MTPPPGAQALSSLRLLLAQAAVLAVAFAGGWAAAASGAPAGWMSGAMIGVTAFAATGLAKPFLAPLRDFVIVLAGVSMGSGASPHALSALTRYPISLAMMTLALAAMTGSAYAVLVRSPGFSRQTARSPRSRERSRMSSSPRRGRAPICRGSRSRRSSASSS